MIHLRDIRYAFRLLARTPGFTLLTVLVLAGGLGLSTFTFSFLYTAIFRARLTDHSNRDRVQKLGSAAVTFSNLSAQRNDKIHARDSEPERS